MQHPKNFHQGALTHEIDDESGRPSAASLASMDHLFRVLKRMPAETDQPPFAEIAQALSEAFEIDHVVIAKVAGSRFQQATCLSCWSLGHHQSAFDYPLANTPCADLYQSQIAYYATRVDQVFPALSELFPGTLESYYGLPLLGSRSEPIGHLALLHREPIEISETFEHFTSLIAVHIALHLERLQLEDLLDQQTQALKQTTENLPGVVYRFTSDRDHGPRFTYISPQLHRVIGIHRDQLLQDAWLLFEMIHPEDRGGLRSAIEHSLKNLSKFDWTGRVKVGEEQRFLQLSSIPLKLPNGAIESSGYMTDVTEIRATEEALHQSDEQLRRAQKLEAIGRLAGGVAHDFNNLLTAILGFGELAIDSLAPEHPAYLSLQEIQRAGERAQELTRKLVAAGRKQILEVSPVDLEEILCEMEPLLRRTLGEDIELVLGSQAEEAVILGDKGSLEQILLNLAVNARDAMPKGGRLLIQTHTGREYLHLTVRDNGCGIANEDLEHIFDPFFTTKPEGKGSGLGLSMVYGIMERLKGYIQVDSQPGVGTTFQLVFPTCTERPKVRSLAKASFQRGHESILVVEDDAAVRRFVTRSLKSIGYHVLEADSSSQALELCRSKRTIDLLLTDVVMPQMKGPELWRQARGIRPDLRHLFITGFTQDSHLLADLDVGDANVLLKPFNREQLGRRLRQILDRSEPDEELQAVKQHPQNQTSAQA